MSFCFLNLKVSGGGDGERGDRLRVFLLACHDIQLLF